MNKILWIAGVFILAGLAAGGGFWAGLKYQSEQAAQARANFENERGPAAMGQAPDGAQGLRGEGMPGMLPGGGQVNGGQMSGFAGTGTVGVVKTIDGDTITISTAMDVTTVNVSESTRVEKYVTTGVADLQVGMQVLVSGQQSDDGVISANQVTILDDSPGSFPGAAQAPYPAATVSEP